MKSASQISAEIRRKKKAMQADPGVVDLSGIPMDKTDIDLMEQNDMTKELGLDTNNPVESSHDNNSPSADSLVSERDSEHERMIPDEASRHRMASGGTVDDDRSEDAERLARKKARISKMMSR